MSEEHKFIPIIPDTIVSDSFDELRKRVDTFEERAKEDRENVYSELSHNRICLSEYSHKTDRKLNKIDEKIEDSNIDILNLKYQIKSIREELTVIVVSLVIITVAFIAYIFIK